MLRTRTERGADKWTPEGAMKGRRPSIPRRMLTLQGKGRVGALMRWMSLTSIKVVPQVLHLSLYEDRCFLLLIRKTNKKAPARYHPNINF
ncbi:hypothetical protein DWV16_08400 [Anaerotruncus sp. AF02-27]|nr:hypothetical protein DWV16_08400 [Anaerotruncus sp. AF02-27]